MASREKVVLVVGGDDGGTLRNFTRSVERAGARDTVEAVAAVEDAAAAAAAAASSLSPASTHVPGFTPHLQVTHTL